MQMEAQNLFAGAAFAEKVYELLRRVPPGRVTTYRELARALGSRAYRGVGQALRRNPYAPEVPCHRVVAASGRIGGFRGRSEGPEIAEKIRLLAAEGVECEAGRVKNLAAVIFTFS
ncbi:MAG: MGMT family protein [Deltaproteobacteria bacterium]|nr:MGMT family protein [Deltaproteobacteria bacterium]